MVVGRQILHFYFVYLQQIILITHHQERPMLNQFLTELRQFVPSDRVYTDELRTLGWGTDASFYRQIPKVVIRSDNEKEVSRIIQLCNKHKQPLYFHYA